MLQYIRNKYLGLENITIPTKIDIESISIAKIGASCGDRVNSMIIVPIICKKENTNIEEKGDLK